MTCTAPGCQTDASRGRYCDTHHQLFSVQGAMTAPFSAPVTPTEVVSVQGAPIGGTYIPALDPDRASQPHPPAMALDDVPAVIELGAGHKLGWLVADGRILGFQIVHPRVMAGQLFDEPGGKPGGAAVLSLGQQEGDPCKLSGWLDTAAWWEHTQGEQAATLVDVRQWSPLTLGAVLHCQCGDTGAVILGQWEAA